MQCLKQTKPNRISQSKGTLSSWSSCLYLSTPVLTAHSKILNEVQAQLRILYLLLLVPWQVCCKKLWRFPGAFLLHKVHHTPRIWVSFNGLWTYRSAPQTVCRATKAIEPPPLIPQRWEIPFPACGITWKRLKVRLYVNTMNRSSGFPISLQESASWSQLPQALPSMLPGSCYRSCRKFARLQKPPDEHSATTAPQRLSLVFPSCARHCPGHYESKHLTLKKGFLYYTYPLGYYTAIYFNDMFGKMHFLLERIRK